VVDIDPDRNAVMVDEAAALERRALRATSVNVIGAAPPAGPLRVEARIRHSHRPAPATLTVLPGGDVEVVFDEPQRAVTPGQSVVWYEGARVGGGGVIARTAAGHQG
jgi:tRNA-specific 2-thiouridylase